MYAVWEKNSEGVKRTILVTYDKKIADAKAAELNGCSVDHSYYVEDYGCLS